MVEELVVVPLNVDGLVGDDVVSAADVATEVCAKTATPDAVCIDGIGDDVRGTTGVVAAAAAAAAAVDAGISVVAGRFRFVVVVVVIIFMMVVDADERVVVSLFTTAASDVDEGPSVVATVVDVS